MVSPTDKDIILMILQFLRKENMTETAHALERESGVFFDMKYFEEMVLDGNFEEAESYFSGFTRIHENKFSTKAFFELRKHKFLEALDRRDRVEALNILTKDMEIFKLYDQKVFKDATNLLPMDNFRQYKAVANYGDPKHARINLTIVLKKCILENPVFDGKLQIPANHNHDMGLQEIVVNGEGVANVVAAASANANANANARAKGIAFFLDK